MKDVGLQEIKEYSEGLCLGDDLLLFRNLKDVPLSEEPWRIKCLFVGLCTSGSAKYTVDTQEFTVHAGDALIISEDRVLANYTPTDDFNGRAFAMSYNFYYEIIRNIHKISALLLFSCNHPVFSLEPKDVESVKMYYEIMNAKLCEKEHLFLRDLIISIINTLICDLSNAMCRIQQLENASTTSADVIFTRFIRLVEKFYKSERKVLWYADQLGITPKYLSETIKKVSKRTPNEWIDTYVIMEVRLLLKNSSMSIKEISEDLNFPSQSFLGKYFKEHMGVSPSKYRKV